MSYFVKFWGTRGSIPTPGNKTKRFGGNTSCVEIRAGDQLLICDAGSGIRELGADLMTRGLSSMVVHLFLTHAHWDHIQGFPFFTPVYIPGNNCFIYGLREGDNRFYNLLSGQMSSDYFPVSFADLRANIGPRHLSDGHSEIGGVSITTHPLEHPGGCIGYSFRWEDRKVVYATDNEIDRVLVDPSVDRKPAGEIRAVREPLVNFVKDADLLISDGQYTDEDYRVKAGWGHPSCLTAVDLAVQAKVKNLAIFHHDPERSDADVDRMIDLCRKRAADLKSDLVVFGAREGVELKI
ncbi:MAG TPA: MBL fold metallo-hydrolase [Terriglobia bacterium]|nr:MBL fold metallo-hydrolase [Terriglobia bacterium]